MKIEEIKELNAKVKELEQYQKDLNNLTKSDSIYCVNLKKIQGNDRFDVQIKHDEQFLKLIKSFFVCKLEADINKLNSEIENFS